MATWPANKETDWNTKMLAYLAIAHATNGHPKYPVNGTPTEVRTKYFTGTLDADSSTSVAHGITGVDNILHVSAAIWNGTSSYAVVDYRSAPDAAFNFKLDWDATNVIFSSVGTSFQSQKYRIKIDYIL